MSILDTFRGTGSRRAVDKVAELRDENRRLITMLAGSDDFFAIQGQLITDLEADVRRLKRQVESGEQTIAQLEAVVRLRDREIDQLKHRLAVGVKAEHVIAETQPIPVLPLWQSPLAGTDPAHIPTLAILD